MACSLIIWYSGFTMQEIVCGIMVYTLHGDNAGIIVIIM